MTGLLPASLRSELNPDHVAAIRNVASACHPGGYHTSFPCGVPVSVSRCRFFEVTRASSCLRVGGLAAGTTTSVRSFRVISTSDPSLTRTSSAKDLGIRKAKLLPHFCTLLFKETSSCIYTEDT
jgi:hypothetical protein